MLSTVPNRILTVRTLTRANFTIGKYHLSCRNTVSNLRDQQSPAAISPPRPLDTLNAGTLGRGSGGTNKCRHSTSTYVQSVVIVRGFHYSRPIRAVPIVGAIIAGLKVGTCNVCNCISLVDYCYAVVYYSRNPQHYFQNSTDFPCVSQSLQWLISQYSQKFSL
jgi:hypothetical protein